MTILLKPGCTTAPVHLTRNLSRIAKTLVVEGQASEREQLARELRRLYWASDIARILEEYIGTKTLGEILSRLRRYASLLYSIICEQTVVETHAPNLADLAALGASSALAEPLLTALVSRESDDEWREDILAAGSNWIRRVLAVNLQVHWAEVDTLIQKTDGRVSQGLGCEQSPSVRPLPTFHGDADAGTNRRGLGRGRKGG